MGHRTATTKSVVTGVTDRSITSTSRCASSSPSIDGSYVQKVIPIQRCGVEDLYIEQTENLWITSVLFDDAWNCWARGVTVKKCGRFPVYGSTPSGARSAIASSTTPGSRAAAARPTAAGTAAATA